MSTTLPVVVLGYGGHAAVVIDALQCAGRTVLGAVGPVLAIGARPDHVVGVPVLGGDEVLIERFPPDVVQLALGVGGGNHPAKRRALFESWCARGYRFTSVVHPSTVISPHASFGHGAQVMAGAVVQARATLGDNVLVNTRASIDHDCQVNEHAHVGPGATLCGHVSIGAGTLVGAGCVVAPARRVAAGVLVRAGTVVTHDWPRSH